MSELALSGSLISALGGSSPFIQKLNELGVTIHKGATVFYKSSEIEFTFHFNMGPISTRVDTILKHVKSFLAKPLEFENIIDIHGYGLTPKENLREMGIIQIEGNKATVDFGKILKEIKSNLVILTVRTKLNEKITQALLSVHIDKNPQHEGDKITSANIEAVLEFTTNIGQLIDEGGEISLSLLTRSGLMTALENDWIIKYPNPDFRFGFLSPEDFTEIYEPVEVEDE